MWEEFLAFLKVSVLPALALILTGLVGFLLQQIEIWKKKAKAKSALFLMKENAADAVKAVDQMYPNEEKETKKRLALEMAAVLNKEGGLENASPQVQLILNESNVNTKREEERKNGVKPEIGVG
jgi:hypothetical protein